MNYPPTAETIFITDFNSDGYGVGRLPSGQVMFARGAVPGDGIAAPDSINANRPKDGIVRVERARIVSPSDRRCPHPCPHYAEGCNGSLLGAYDYGAALAWKRERLRQILRRIGGMKKSSLSRSSRLPSAGGTGIEWSFTSLIRAV